VSLGEGLFAPSANSGEPMLGAPGEAGFAAIAPGMVEASNVDLAEELTTLLIAQRAYSASARAFRVGDDMLAIATKLTG
jgi:flagellar hook protein FlgE